MVMEYVMYVYQGIQWMKNLNAIEKLNNLNNINLISNNF